MDAAFTKGIVVKRMRPTMTKLDGVGSGRLQKKVKDKKKRLADLETGSR